MHSRHSVRGHRSKEMKLNALEAKIRRRLKPEVRSRVKPPVNRIKRPEFGRNFWEPEN